MSVLKAFGKLSFAKCLKFGRVIPVTPKVEILVISATINPFPFFPVSLYKYLTTENVYSRNNIYSFYPHQNIINTLENVY